VLCFGCVLWAVGVFSNLLAVEERGYLREGGKMDQGVDGSYSEAVSYLAGGDELVRNYRILNLGRMAYGRYLKVIF